MQTETKLEELTKEYNLALRSGSQGCYSCGYI